jgi:hypothetical protein
MEIETIALSNAPTPNILVVNRSSMKKAHTMRAKANEKERIKMRVVFILFFFKVNKMRLSIRDKIEDSYSYIFIYI